MGMLVSINCITYNHEKYIAEAIEGFLMQKTTFDYEILIGEDCSTDGTREIVEKYVKDNPEKIKLITSEENVGASKNSLRLLENSSGKYIALCEGDDYWTNPFKLQKQVDYMEEHPECSLCFHAARIVRESGKELNNVFRPYTQNTISATEHIIGGGGEFCPTASLIFPRSLLQNIPDFLLRAHVGDYPLQMWLSSIGYAYYMDEFMSVYRRGALGSWTMSQNSGHNVVEKIIKLKKADINLLNEFNEYSNYKYQNQVEKTIMKIEFEILLTQNRIREIKRSKYKRHLESKGITQKVKIYTRFYFPKLYSTILQMKRSILDKVGT